MTIAATVNGRPVAFDGDPDMPLLWALRDELGLTGTKFGCGIAACGACTVHLDGVATRSCSVPIAEVAGKAITTIEGLKGADGALHPLQAAWIAHQVPQCGYCQSGFLMATVAAMKQGLHGADIAGELSNVCLCGTYPRIAKAIAAL